MSKKKASTWSGMNKEEKIARLTDLWRKGLSDEKIGEALGASKGQIVGFRHTHTKLTAANRYAANDPTLPSKPTAAPEDARNMPVEIAPSDALTASSETLPVHVAEAEIAQDLVQEPEPLPVATPEPSAVIEIKIHVAVAHEVPGCVWPLAKSSGVKVIDCGKQVVPGFRCCEEHAPLLYGKRFIER